MTKNILICIPSYTYGGAEIHSFNTAKALRKLEGVQIYFLAFGRKDNFQEKLENEGFKTLHFPLSDFLTLSLTNKFVTLFRLLFFLRKFKFHSLFAGTEQCNLLMGLVWKGIGAKHFFWHQWGIDPRKNCSYWERLVIKTQPTYIANSEACRGNIAERHCIENTTKIQIIHNTFNEDLLNVTKVGNKDSFRIAMVANFFDEKDHTTVLNALRLFADKYPTSVLKVLFAGRNNGSQLLFQAKAKAFDLDLYPFVEFVGQVENIAEFLSGVDIGLLSTKSEGLSNALLEYMAVGLPVIATDIPQNREALSSENKFFPVGDEKACFELFEYFYLNQNLIQEIGKSNRKYVIEHFSNSVYQNKILKLVSSSLFGEGQGGGNRSMSN